MAAKLDAWRPWARWALSLALLGLCALGLRDLDVGAMASALRRADPRLAALAALLNLLHIVFKSERWRLLLSPVARVPAARLYFYLVVSWGASMVLPQALGEALRVHVLKRRHGVPVAHSVAVVLAEKLFEALGLALILLPVPFALRLPRAVAVAVLSMSLGGLAVGAAVVVAARSAWVARWGPLARLSPALGSLRDPRLFAPALAWSVAGHALECAVILMMLSAVGVRVPVAASCLVLLGHALAVLAPLTPGRVGVSEAGIVAALSLAGVPLAPALAFALAYRATLLAPLVALVPGHALIAEERAALARAATDAPGPTPRSGEPA